MKTCITMVFVLFIFGNLIAQDKKSTGEIKIWPLSEDQLRMQDKTTEYPHYFQPENLNLPPGEQESVYDESWIPGRLSAIQDTFYRPDSTLYYRYPSDNDSVIDQKEIPYYLPGGNIIDIFYSFDYGLSSWVNNSKNEYLYDTLGVDRIYIYSVWNKSEQDWRRVRRDDLKSNDNGMIILREYFNWDTISNQWVTDYKYFYDYDDHGNRILYGRIQWSKEENIWISGYRDEYEFNEKGQLTMDVHYLYDPYWPRWMGTTKSIREYIGENLIARTYYTWSEWENDWLPFKKEEYQYNEHNLQTAFLTSIYSEYMQEWTYQTKNERAYNDSGNLILEINLEWSYEETWTNTNKKEYIYNETNQLILSSNFAWIVDAWVIQSQDTTVYFDSGNISRILNLTRSSEEALWDSISKTENIFDEITGNTETLNYQYIEDDWRLVQKTIRRHDVYGNDYLEEYIWDNSLQKLIGTLIGETIIRDNGLFRQITVYYWSIELNNWIGSNKYYYVYADFGGIKSYARFAWDMLAADWKIDYKYFRYYSMVITSDANHLSTESNNISVYPNPAGDYLNISLVKEYPADLNYHIYGLDGKLITAGQLNEQTTMINTSGLKDGMYIIRVGEGRTFYSLKFIIEK